MTKDGDDKGLDEHTRIGVASTPKLPGAPPPAEPPAPAAPPAPIEEYTKVAATPPPPTAPRAAPAAPPPLDEQTRLAGTPPPVPKPPAAAPPDESTRLAAAAPPLPKPPAAAPPDESTRLAQATPPSPKPAGTTEQQRVVPPPLPTGGGDFPDQTIVLPPQQREVVPPARFQRLQPPGRSDIVTLNRTHYLMGRLPSCDLRLFSQTASREHARLTARDGRWYLTPVPGKLVLVNGSPVKEEVPLTHKMRLQLGGDELLFLDESGARVAEGDEAPQGGMTELVDKRWLWAVIGLLAVAVVLWWVLR